MPWGVPKIGAVATAASGNITLAEPAGIASGDLMIACIGYRSNAAFTVPGDWNLVATQQSSGDTDATNGIASGVMLWCVRGGSAPTLTFTRTAGDVAQGQIIAYSGAHTSPFGSGVAGTLASASATVNPGAAVVTSESSQLVVAMVSCGDALTVSNCQLVTGGTASGATDTTTAPTASVTIERADTSTSTGADHGLAIFDAIRPTATSQNVQATVSASARHVMIVGTFKLAAGPSTVTVNDTSTATEARTVAGEASQADTATGIESVGASIPITVDDTATASDTSSTVTGISAADTASVSEALILEGTRPQADTATAVETEASGISINVADTATAEDSESEVSGVSTFDTATGDEALNVTGSASVTDTSAGADLLSASTEASETDSSTASDSPSAGTEVSTADTAMASEALQDSGDVSAVDVSSASEGLTTGGTVSVSDLSATNESEALEGALSLADLGTASDLPTDDNPAGPSASNQSDLATTSELLSFDVVMVQTDFATSNEADEFLGVVGLADLGSVVEQFSGSLVITVTDGATGTDLPGYSDGAPVLTPPHYITLSSGERFVKLTSGEKEIQLVPGEQYISLGE